MLYPGDPFVRYLGEGYWLGKVVPAVLSVLAAAATSWLQFRKPQRLWAIYRRAQRELEREKAAFDFGLAEYADTEAAHKRLAAKVSDIAFRVHEQWEGLVPEPDTLAPTLPSFPDQLERAPMLPEPKSAQTVLQTKYGKFHWPVFSWSDNEQDNVMVLVDCI